VKPALGCGKEDLFSTNSSSAAPDDKGFFCAAVADFRPYHQLAALRHSRLYDHVTARLFQAEVAKTTTGQGVTFPTKSHVANRSSDK
jgi:hypothetical protein